MDRIATKRYEELGIRDALTRAFFYSMACKELNFIIRSPAFDQFPKNLHSLLFQDILTAFRLLPQMQTKAAAWSANTLVQSVEAVLPKQRKVLAVKEFKNAMVAHKRGSKNRNQEEGLVQLPEDILAHIFSYLDLQSLLSAASVCRSWNAAAGDNHLWHLQYNIFFSTFASYSKVEGFRSVSVSLVNNETCTLDDSVSSITVEWKNAFKEAYKGISVKQRNSTRGYCRHCNAIVWLDRMKCFKDHLGGNSNNHQIKFLSLQQIVEFILFDSFCLKSPSDSDSDSDSDERIVSKLWAYSKHGRLVF